MFWIVLFVIASMAGVAYGLISITWTRERLLVSLEIAKARSVFEQFKQAGSRLFHKCE
jgi:hypothetical protein